MNRRNLTLGVSYLFITHNIGAVESIADPVTVMNRGRIEEQGTAEEVLAACCSASARALLAAVPRIASAVTGRQRTEVDARTRLNSMDVCGGTGI